MNRWIKISLKDVGFYTDIYKAHSTSAKHNLKTVIWNKVLTFENCSTNSLTSKRKQSNRTYDEYFLNLFVI